MASVAGVPTVAFPRATQTQGLVGGDESFSRIDLGQLRAAGITALIRYIAGSGKGLSRSEYEAIIAAEFSLAWVMETFEQAASLGGPQGRKEAAAAYAAADAIGWPADRPGYFVLEDPSPIPRSQWPAVADYMREVVDLAPRRPLPGGYGSGALCAYIASQGLIAHQWHVSTWPGLDRSVADIVQEANGLHGYGNFGGAIDLNTIRDDNPDWGQHPFTPPGPPAPPAPADPTEERTMFSFWHRGAVYPVALVPVAGDMVMRRSANGLPPCAVDAMIAAGLKIAGSPDDDRSELMAATDPSK